MHQLSEEVVWALHGRHCDELALPMPAHQDAEDLGPGETLIYPSKLGRALS